MTIKSEQTVAAERLRSQKEASTDPARLEREARDIERRGGIRFLCNMPRDGLWHTTQYEGKIVVSSPEHGVFRLEVTTTADKTVAEWVKVDMWNPVKI